MPYTDDHLRQISADTAFAELAVSWMKEPARQFLGFIWSGYDSMVAAGAVVDCRDLERSITQLLEPRVRDAMTGDEPFYIQHGPFEHETMSAPPAQPPEYDLAFVFRTDERVMWPLEAKVLETPRRMSNYMRDLNEEYLTCRYAPFSNSAAMLGYLLTGRAGEAFLEIEGRLGQKLEGVPAHAMRPNRMSHHKRDVPRGTRYPSEFSCFHLILEYRGLRRAGGRRGSSGEDIESPAV